jgi:hypothetical protein
MDSQRLTEDVTAFFDEYTQAFDSIDGARIARLYYAPCVTMRGDGSIHCLQSQDELRGFFQGVADTYYKDGYRSARFSDLGVVPIGGRSVLVTVDWELLREDKSPLRQWRQSYNLVRADGSWRILVSTFHVT